jgi:tRNA A-37 threonylcarbamoyl transferase component Bud32
MGDDTLLAGKYRLGDMLGAGGMAVVHVAVNVLTEREVAIKRLLPRYASDPHFVSRFEREAKAAGRVRSPHVVEVIDVGFDEAGLPFIVMERLHGEPLSAKLKREGALPATEALDVAAQILVGVASAHRAGVVHRDLKPANVFLERHDTGEVVAKIVDFGISKVTTAGEEANELTRTGDSLGSYPYMSPEQIRSTSKAGPQTDLWAVGIIIHRMLTGQNPFHSEDSLGLVAGILEEAPALLEAGGVVAPVCAAAQPVILRALQKDVSLRYQSAAEMRDDVLRARGELSGYGAERVEGVRASVSGPSTLSTGGPLNAAVSLAPPSAGGTQLAAQPPEQARPRGKLVALGLAALAFVAVAGAVSIWIFRAPVASEPARPPGEVCIALDVAPAGATVLVDGMPWGAGRCVPVGAAPVQLVVAADGHAPAALPLTRESASPQIVHLAPAGAAEAGATGATGTPAATGAAGSPVLAAAAVATGAAVAASAAGAPVEAGSAAGRAEWADSAPATKKKAPAAPKPASRSPAVINVAPY